MGVHSASMAARPVVSVYSASEDKTGTCPLPDVLVTPIRQDIVHRVHTNVNKTPASRMVST